MLCQAPPSGRAAYSLACFCGALGIPELAQDPDFATNPASVANRVRLRERLDVEMPGWALRQLVLKDPNPLILIRQIEPNMQIESSFPDQSAV